MEKVKHWSSWQCFQTYYLLYTSYENPLLPNVTLTQVSRNLPKSKLTLVVSPTDIATL